MAPVCGINPRCWYVDDVVMSIDAIVMDMKGWGASEGKNSW